MCWMIRGEKRIYRVTIIQVRTLVTMYFQKSG